MDIKTLLVIAMTLTPAAAFAQGDAGYGAGISPPVNSEGNGASNTANCMPGNSVSTQRSVGNSAMNNNPNSNAVGKCDRTANRGSAQGSSAMSNRGSGNQAGATSSGPTR